MHEKDLPQPFGIEEINFRGCFTAPSLRVFVTLIVGWVLTVGRHAISNVILTMSMCQYRHFSGIYRFLAKACWEMDSVSYRLFRVMLDSLVPAGSVVETVLDDTLNGHRGKQICGAAWQHDGSKPEGSGRKGFGVCFVVIGLVVRMPELSDRVFCLPYAARLWCPKGAKVKSKGTYKKKTELGLELIRLTASWLNEDEALRVIGDPTYACRTILRELPRGVHMTGRARINSSLYHPPLCPIKRPRGRPRTKGDRMPAPRDMFKDPDIPWERVEVERHGKKSEQLVYQFYAVWPYVTGKQIVLFGLWRDPSGTYGDSVLFDTKLTADPQTIDQRYSTRRSIELTFRETKQLLGAADPQCRKENSVKRSVMLAYWAYCFVVMWFVENFRKGKGVFTTYRPWYRQKKNISFHDMLATARRSHFKVAFLRDSPQIMDFWEIGCARFTRGKKHTECAKL